MANRNPNKATRLGANGAPNKKGGSIRLSATTRLKKEGKTVRGAAYLMEMIDYGMSAPFHFNVQRAGAISDKDTTPTIEVLFSYGVMMFRKTGDPRYINPWIDRWVGRAKEHITVAGDRDNPLNVTLGLKELEAKAEALAQKRREVGND
jgi:hypothetical protein